MNIDTGSVSCNSNRLILKETELPIEIVVGVKFLTSNIRMKAGTS